MSDEFLKAIKQGETSRVEQMVQRNPNLSNARDAEGMSAVTIATYYGQPKIAELLILKGARLDVFEASMVGKLEIIRDEISNHPNLVSSFSKDGFTGLHLAAFFGRSDVVRYLIERGTDVNSVARNLMKVTPLHSAAATSQVYICKILLENGADVNAKQEGSFTPLHAAAQNGNLELSKLLLRYGADINARTDKGKTPLDLAEEEGKESGPRESRDKVVKFLIENGAR